DFNQLQFDGNYQINTLISKSKVVLPTYSDAKTVFVPAGENSVAIPIVATDDINKESAENVQVTLKTGTGYTLNPDTIKQSATLNIIDNEQIAIQVVNASIINDPVTNTPSITYASTLNPLVVSEVGSKEYLGVHLTSKPTTNVTLALSSTDATEGEVTPNTLTFTTDNWNQYQNVTVTGKQDTVNDKNVDYQIKLKAISTDSFYSGQEMLIDAKTTDDEQPANTTLPTGDPVNNNRPTASLVVTQLPTETQDGKFTINLSAAIPANSQPITVLFGDQGNSATFNKDYYFSGSNIFLSQYAIANNNSGAKQKMFDSPLDNIKPGSNAKFTFGDLDGDG
ncbi:MAG: hypothetical protein ACRC2J_00685, partial [Microcoleaceae cyanobacterium]